MASDYKIRFKNMIEEIKAEAILDYARMNGSASSFTRKRKMPASDVIISIIGRKGLTAAMDIGDYFTEKNIDESISKQAYLNQRKKLNYEVFSHLNTSYLQNFYSELKTEELYRGYLVLAVDGSKAEVPASKENIVKFGEQTKESGIVRALVSCISDVFNKFTLDMQLGSIYESESELAVTNITRAQGIVGNLPIIVLFDRGYPGLRLINTLEDMGIKYLFRLSSNDYKNERAAMKTDDEPVKLQHSYPRLAKIRKKHAEAADLLAAKKYTDSRIIRSQTPSGEEIAFATNLTSSEWISEDIISLYFMRWKIEESYNTLKNKLKFESVTGEATIYVYQDFWSQILVYNMVQDMLNSANADIAEREETSPHKYPIHANENMAIGLFKRSIIGLMLEDDSKKREHQMHILLLNMEKYTLPYRKLKGRGRKFLPSNKNKRNLKKSF